MQHIQFLEKSIKNDRFVKNYTNFEMQLTYMSNLKVNDHPDEEVRKAKIPVYFMFYSVRDVCLYVYTLKKEKGLYYFNYLKHVPCKGDFSEQSF